MKKCEFELSGKKLVCVGNWAGLLLSVLFVFVFCYCYVRAEQFLYHWDYAGYWILWEQFRRMLVEGHVLRALNALRISLIDSDYNLLPIVVPSVIGTWLGSSRWAYIASMALSYYIPLNILMQLMLQQLVGELTLKQRYLIGIATLSFVPFWAPVLRGYPDLVGLVCMVVALLIAVRNDFTQASYRQAIWLGFTLWLVFAMRRWYLYTAVTMSLSLPLFNWFWHLEMGTVDRQQMISRVKRLVANCLVAGVTCVLLICMLQYKWLHRILSSDYSVLYVAYNFGRGTAINLLVRTLGKLNVIWFIGTLSLFGLLSRKGKLFLLFCLFNLVASFCLFTCTQSPGVQHRLPFVFWIFIMVVGSWLQLENRWSTLGAKRVVWIVISVMVASQLGGFVMGLLPLSIAKDGRIHRAWFPGSCYPIRMKNYSSYLQLLDFIAALPDRDTVAVFSSSDVLSDDMLTVALTKRDSALSGKVLQASQVDARDQFRPEVLLASYVVVVDPVQTHLRPDDQLVIAAPAISILRQEDIGQAYTKLPLSFELDRGATALIYKKSRIFAPDEVVSFFSKFYKRYPEWQKLYDTPTMQFYLRSHIRQLGDVWGHFSLSSEGDAILTHPGENIPTVVVAHKPSTVIGMVFTSTNCSCNQEDDIIIQLRDSCHALVSEVYLPHGASKRVQLPNELQELEINISKHRLSGCDAVKIELF